MTNTRDRGATAVEYGLMLAAIAAIIIGLVFGIGTVLQGMYAETRDCLAAGVDAVNPCVQNPPGG